MAQCLGSWARAPLVLSVIEIGYAKRANFEEEVKGLGALQQSGAYPFVEDGKIVELKIQSSLDQLQVEKEESNCRVLMNQVKSVAARVLSTKLSFFDADYSGNFEGSIKRFREVLDKWVEAAPKLMINEVRVRTLDVACPPEGTTLNTWLRDKWQAGDLNAPSSRGMALRDFGKPDGSFHVRVHTVGIRAGQRIAPPPDLMRAVHVNLPNLIGPFDREAIIALVDVEKVVQGETFKLDELADLLQKAHAEASDGFKDVFKPAAIDYFRGNDLEGVA